MALDLATAVQRYHERAKFYAWDIYEVLSSRYKATYATLQQISHFEKPVTLEDVMSAVTDGGPRGASTISRHLTLLTAHQLLRNTRPRGSHAYAYQLTELGTLVLSCDPVLPPKINPTEKTMVQQKALYDWDSLDPEIKRLRQAGMTYPEIGKELGIHPVTARHRGNTVGLALPSLKHRHPRWQWESLTPEIRQYHEQGRPLEDIAQVLNIPLATLQHNAWRWTVVEE